MFYYIPIQRYIGFNYWAYLSYEKSKISHKTLALSNLKYNFITFIGSLA